MFPNHDKNDPNTAPGNDPNKPEPLGGQGKILEADQSHFGGKEENKHVGKRNNKNIGGQGKQPVFALVERDGISHSFRVATISGKTLRPLIVGNVSRNSSLMTDDSGQ